MALFVDILVHPLGNSAQADLETMKQVVSIFQLMTASALSNAESRQMQTVNDFMLELVRLASCAISKAGKQA